MLNGHRFTVTVDGEGAPTWNLECFWATDDDTRPCWPEDEDGTKMPGPEQPCNLKEWLDAADAEDLIHGRATFEIVEVDVQWADGPEFHISTQHITDADDPLEALIGRTMAIMSRESPMPSLGEVAHVVTQQARNFFEVGGDEFLRTMVEHARNNVDSGSGAFRAPTDELRTEDDDADA